LGFATLSTPTGSSELVALKEVDELFLVAVGFKAYDLLKESSGVSA